MSFENHVNLEREASENNVKAEIFACKNYAQC